MSSTESSLSETQIVFNPKEKLIKAQDFAYISCSSINLTHTNITLNISFAYSNRTAQYIINTKIINSTKVCLNSLCGELSNYLAIDTYSISYSDNEGEVYFFCGQYPFDKEVILCELTSTLALWLKLRTNINNNLKIKFDLYEEEREDYSDKFNNDNSKRNYYINTNSSRANERVIGDIIQKVYLWSQLHKGVLGDKYLIKLTYQQAADEIGISKKTLSNYYEHLKLGKYFQFDFNNNKHNKVNVLNKFIKTKVKSLSTSMIKRIKSRKNHIKNKKEQEMPWYIIKGLSVIDDAFTFEDATE